MRMELERKARDTSRYIQWERTGVGRTNAEVGRRHMSNDLLFRFLLVRLFAFVYFRGTVRHCVWVGPSP